MSDELIALLKELADVLEKHKGGFFYTTADNGIHVSINGNWNDSVCILWPNSGDVDHIRDMIKAHK